MQTCPCNKYPLISQQGYCGYSLEPPNTKYEFSDAQMLRQGKFCTVFKASKDDKKNVIKDLTASDTTEADIKLLKKKKHYF